MSEPNRQGTVYEQPAIVRREQLAGLLDSSSQRSDAGNGSNGQT